MDTGSFSHIDRNIFEVMNDLVAGCLFTLEIFYAFSFVFLSHCFLHIPSYSFFSCFKMICFIYLTSLQKFASLMPQFSATSSRTKSPRFGNVFSLTTNLSSLSATGAQSISPGQNEEGDRCLKLSNGG